MPRRALVALLALGLALVVLRAPWSEAPRAQPQRVAISRSGVLGGANYVIEVPENWRGGLVVSMVDTVDIIDSDTHVIEPYDLWTSRLSQKKWGNLIRTLNIKAE